MFDIISIGSATFDIFLKSKKFPLDRMMIGEKIEMDECVYASGGGGSNTAAGFSRLGLNTACIARFGDDLFGQFVFKDLEKEKFDRKYLQQRKGDSTDYSTILINPDGSRIILVNRGKTRIDEKIFPWEALKETKYLYIASIEGNVDLLLKIIEKATVNGVKVILNPGSRELKEKNKLIQVFPRIKALILNCEEAESFDSVENIVKFGAEITVITNGRRGTKLFSKEKNLFIESFVCEAVDETGAGDAFSSGFSAGLVRGFSLEDSLKMGMANGASVVSQIGAKPGLLDEGKMKEMMVKKLKVEQIS